MLWSEVIASIQKNKGLVISLAIGIILYVGVGYIKNGIYTANKLKQDAQIQELLSEINNLTGQRDIQKQATAAALLAYNEQKDKATLIQKKVDALVYEHNHPAVVTHTFINVSDCNEALVTLETKYRSNEETYIAEITQDRIIIANGDEVIKKQGIELNTNNTIINKNSEVIKVLQTRVAAADEKVNKEINKKKTWRTTSFVEAAVIIGLSLLL